ncbi:MAG: type II secretion system inner membrane protein GspF [Xanthomonadales bacterium]|jgi:general secretion pathway protein F|nr:type II secretion system inner membrane protein GspF [Xanthomonadales bacterium]
MPAFEFQALDPAGREQRGVLEADSPRQVRQLLRDRQWLPVSVLEVGERRATAAGPTIESPASAFARLRRGLREPPARIGGRDLALITRQLATLVRAALPLEEALQAVAQQTDRPAAQRILTGVRARVMEGDTLATALGGFPRVFPEIYRATVGAGEQSGRLDTVLERLADYTERRDQLRQRVLGALLYPIVLTAMCVVVVAGLLTYVVPQVVAVFESGGNSLPWLTRALLAVSAFLREWGLLLLSLAALGGFAFMRWLRAKAARRRFEGLLLRLPLLGRLLRSLGAARFTRTFSILIGSAVPALEGLRIAGATVGNLPMSEAIEAAAERVREGAPIGRSLAASGLFPPLTVHLVSSGESSGRLEEMLGRAADAEERELDRLLTAFVGLLGPLLIVAMGILVLLIVFAMLQPIFEMNTLVR